MNPALLLFVPVVFAAAYLLDKALARLVLRKYERMLYRQYYKGVYDTKHEQKALISQLRERVWSLEAQVRRLRQSTSNGVRP